MLFSTGACSLWWCRSRTVCSTTPTCCLKPSSLTASRPSVVTCSGNDRLQLTIALSLLYIIVSVYSKLRCTRTLYVWWDGVYNDFARAVDNGHVCALVLLDL